MSNLQGFLDNMGKNAPFYKALQEWNRGKPQYCIPKKGTKEHEQVMKIMNDKFVKKAKKKKKASRQNRVPAKAPARQSSAVRPPKRRLTAEDMQRMSQRVRSQRVVPAPNNSQPPPPPGPPPQPNPPASAAPNPPASPARRSSRQKRTVQSFNPSSKR